MASNFKWTLDAAWQSSISLVISHSQQWPLQILTLVSSLALLSEQTPHPYVDSRHAVREGSHSAFFHHRDPYLKRKLAFLVSTQLYASSPI